MARQSNSKLRRFSNVLNIVGCGIEAYNAYAHNSKNRNLSRIGLVINVTGGILDFYTALQSGRFFTKIFSFANLVTVFATSYKRFKALKSN